jgi:hypothetical protein
LHSWLCALHTAEFRVGNSLTIKPIMNPVVTKESGHWSISAIRVFQGEITLSPLSTRTKIVPTNPLMPQAYLGLREDSTLGDHEP